MIWLNGYKKKLVLIGLVSAIVLGVGASVRADFTFGEPTNLGPIVNSSFRDERPAISSDGLELFFHSRRSGGFGNADLYVTTRPTIDDDWSEPINL